MLLFVIQTRCRTPYIFEGLTIDPIIPTDTKPTVYKQQKIDRNRRTKRQKKKQKKRQTEEEPRASRTRFLFPAREREEESREKREPHDKERRETEREKREIARKERRNLRDGNGEKFTTD